ncbi:hypothetical protein DEU56DRAFT_918774 [Suillus clintonianus]|uniref:uncharacterized protein n=1 Tax=Suillus clintonianus TaxID=1904413 RepID=UPI001B886327|nr:uncharacterized protein DEU56DRAFT_918774 [Suillus clintonianus]KAG2118614.1 hypothetical protein DEU56DRAFT_918774 [Suillus clintonianus]
MPQDETTAQNLRAQISKEFPWYDDLAGIMGGNPALSLKTISSRPGVDHSANFFSILRMAGSSYSDTLRSGSAQFNAQQSQPPPQSQPPLLSISPHIPPAVSPRILPAVSLTPLQVVSLTLLPQAATLTIPQAAILTLPPAVSPPIPRAVILTLPQAVLLIPLLPTDYATGAERHQQYGQQPHQPYSGLPPAPSHSTFNSPLDDTDINMPDYDDDETMDFSFNNIPRPPPPLRRDYHDDPNPISLNTPSPSPPITPPPQSEFVLPRPSQTSHRDGRASFNMADPKRRTSAGSPKPISRRSSGSSQSKPASRRVKKQRSDIQSQVDTYKDEIEKVQLDRVSRDELKNERYMVKYNIARQLNKHKYLEAERTGGYAEAAVAHQRSQEAKDAEIRLREAEIKVHDTLANVHAEEAATLCLKIELARLTSSNSGS